MSMDNTTGTTMYTLGLLARAIWPKGDMPPSMMDTALVQPLAGLALMTKHEAARRADKEQLAYLIDKLPADLANPSGGIKVEDQGPFWMGWYHYMTAMDRAKTWGPEQLARAGTLLFGTRWQSDLARAINVGDRRVREWAAGDARVPPGVWADIAGLLRQRQSEGLALLREMDRR